MFIATCDLKRASVRQERKCTWAKIISSKNNIALRWSARFGESPSYIVQQDLNPGGLRALNYHGNSDTALAMLEALREGLSER